MQAGILVTGASGAIGGLVVRQLLARAGDVRVLAAARSASKRARLEATGAHTVHIAYDDPASLAASMRGIERLFLVTGYTAQMVADSKAVLDAARDAGVRHVVHLGAMGCDKGLFPHLDWHRVVERHIEGLGLTYTHLRPATYMRNVLVGLRPGPPVLRHFYGDARLGWVDPGDIAAVAVEALLEPDRHAGGVFELAAQVATMAEVAAVVAAETKLPFTAEARNPADALAIFTKLGMEPRYAQSLAAALEATSRHELESVIVADETIERVTGRPATDWRCYAERHRDRFVAALQPPAAAR